MASTVRLFSRNGRSGDFKQIGVIQSFKPTDSRKMERARGVGFGDRVAEIVPGLTEVSITCQRMALYEENILESFGYHTGWNKGGLQGTVRTLAHMKNPFDINEVIVFHARQGQKDTTPFQGGNERIGFFPTEYTSFWYHDCWINNWGRTIEITGNLIYMEDVTIDVTWVSDGVEPAPYADTDVWDTHGLNCNTGSFDVGLIEETPTIVGGGPLSTQNSNGPGNTGATTFATFSSGFTKNGVEYRSVGGTAANPIFAPVIGGTFDHPVFGPPINGNSFADASI